MFIRPGLGGYEGNMQEVHTFDLEGNEMPGVLVSNKYEVTRPNSEGWIIRSPASVEGGETALLRNKWNSRF